ncbi:hypothetical protein BDK51DRAFT_36882 [Blyttiomyces helicus]|uniref:Uncharacterized protein n=1 Tax=Blyttiomyces helicus TaxID=388810 RepID=A0A4P9W5I9_9FUNG|nr:hypothetical protein BDK51DRAFT_36882 [Blyttiomyces helicus]|eukprot:RKO87222.1 hypothetical protein BDK51DRAFT_36882 [Blyttiomyces helicus]
MFMRSIETALSCFSANGRVFLASNAECVNSQEVLRPQNRILTSKLVKRRSWATGARTPVLARESDRGPDTGFPLGLEDGGFPVSPVAKDVGYKTGTRVQDPCLLWRAFAFLPGGWNLSLCAGGAARYASASMFDCSTDASSISGDLQSEGPRSGAGRFFISFRFADWDPAPSRLLLAFAGSTSVACDPPLLYPLCVSTGLLPQHSGRCKLPSRAPVLSGSSQPNAQLPGPRPFAGTATVFQVCIGLNSTPSPPSSPRFLWKEVSACEVEVSGDLQGPRPMAPGAEARAGGQWESGTVWFPLVASNWSAVSRRGRKRDLGANVDPPPSSFFGIPNPRSSPDP